jgi:general secretion pathway protein F
VNAAAYALPDALRARVHLQMAALERAGVPVLQALGMLELPTSEQARVQRALQLLRAGQPLAMAGRIAGLFTPMESTVIAAAVQGGSPANAHQRLAERASARAAQFKQVRARLALPAFVLLAALFILPLPALVAGHIGVVWYLARIVLFLSAAAGLFALGREIYLRQAAAEDWPGREPLESLLLRLPLIGGLVVRTQAQRFFEHLALLLEAGLPAVDAVTHAASTLRLQCIRADFESMLPALQAGASLSQAAEELDYLGSSAVLGMLSTGEGSGRLPELLQRYADGEAALLSSEIEQIATWLPRFAYALLALWLAVQFIGSFAGILQRRID